MTVQLLVIAVTALAVTGAVETMLPATTPMHDETGHPEARPYDEHAEAMVAVDQALARAKASGKGVLLVMGANWCHDSRGLAGWLETPRFASLVEPHFETVFIDAGEPREGRPSNMHVARRFGVETLVGTPNLFVLDGDGRRLNSIEDVTGWTDAASRDEDEIYDYIRSHIPSLAEGTDPQPND